MTALLAKLDACLARLMLFMTHEYVLMMGDVV